MRRVTLIAAAVLLVGFALPAYATEKPEPKPAPQVSGEASCIEEKGVYEIAWTVANPLPLTMTIDATTPDVGLTGQEVPGKESAGATQEVPGDTTEASLKVAVHWGEHEASGEASVELAGDCEAPPVTTQPTPTTVPDKSAPPVEPKAEELPFTGPSDLLLPVGLALIVVGVAVVYRLRYRPQH